MELSLFMMQFATQIHISDLGEIKVLDNENTSY